MIGRLIAFLVILSIFLTIFVMAGAVSHKIITHKRPHIERQYPNTKRWM